MNVFLLVCAAIVLVSVAGGLARALRGPGDTERIMAAQLLGAGGIAALLLFGAAADSGSAIDLALTLALLSAFAAIAFVKKGTTLETPPPSNDGAVDDSPPNGLGTR